MNEEKKLFARFRDAKIVEMLEVEVNEGNGTEDDPTRRVAYLLTKSGRVLAKIGEDRERKFAGEDEIENLN